MEATLAPRENKAYILQVITDSRFGYGGFPIGIQGIHLREAKWQVATSRTTLIAAEPAGMIRHGMELNPAYGAVEREGITGQTAALTETGGAFAALKALRLARSVWACMRLRGH